jgi:gas vesicle protein
MKERYESGFSGMGVLMAFIGGAAAGAAAALLLTPKTGIETRENLRKIAGDAKDKVARAPKALREAYAQGAEVAKEAFTGAYESMEKNVGHH